MFSYTTGPLVRGSICTPALRLSSFSGIKPTDSSAFVDGNKRIGMYVMLTFLEVNGIRLDCANDEVIEVGLAVASGAMDYEALLAWVRAHRV